MLRITVTTGSDRATLTLEGRVAGPWLEEIARSWSHVRAPRDARAVEIHLDAVTFIDAGGKSLLRTIHEQGAVLVASGCMTRAIVDEIRKTARPA